MIVTTTDLIPGKEYEIINLVYGNRTMSFLSKTELSKAVEKMTSDAKLLGADAVVGVKPYTTPNGGTCVIGTAVKFI